MTAGPPVALVTGSTSGIGLAIARRLAADGMRVGVHSRRSHEAGERIARELDGAYFDAELLDVARCRELVTRCQSSLGRLDVLVNNAGMNVRIPHDDLEAATPEIWRQMFDIHVLAPWTLIAAAKDALAASAGASGSACVVNISSQAGVRPKGASVPYAASKAALNHVTRLLAVALAPRIRVNAVAPGLVETPMTAEMPEARRLWEEQAPMGRPAQPEEVADMVAALIANPYVTGEVIVLDGGLNLR